ncbi:hypothetical protein EW026_g7941, partial [Hermanssonia centrifuga]
MMSSDESQSDEDFDINDAAFQDDPQAAAEHASLFQRPHPHDDMLVFEYQEKLTLAKDMVLHLRMDVTGLCASQVGCRGADKDVSTATLKRDPEVHLAGRFFVLISPWLSVKIPSVRPNIDPKSLERYASAEAAKMAAQVEVHDHFPKGSKVLSTMGKLTHVEKLFCHCLNDQHSKLTSAAGSLMPFLFTTVSAEAWASWEVQKTDPEATRLRGEEGQIFSAPFIFPPDAEGDPDQAFKNPALVRLFRGIVFGRTAIRPNSRPKGNTLGKLWDIFQATRGMVAYTCCTAAYHLSYDDTFAEDGKGEWEKKLRDDPKCTDAPPEFSYGLMFRSIVRLLHELEATDRVKSILDFWTKVAFDGVDPVVVRTATSKSQQHEADRLFLEMFRADKVVSSATPLLHIGSPDNESDDD